MSGCWSDESSEHMQFSRDYAVLVGQSCPSCLVLLLNVPSETVFPEILLDSVCQKIVNLGWAWVRLRHSRKSKAMGGSNDILLVLPVLMRSVRLIGELRATRR